MAIDAGVSLQGEKHRDIHDQTIGVRHLLGQRLRRLPSFDDEHRVLIDQLNREQDIYVAIARSCGSNKKILDAAKDERRPGTCSPPAFLPPRKLLLVMNLLNGAEASCAIRRALPLIPRR